MSAGRKDKLQVWAEKKGNDDIDLDEEMKRIEREMGLADSSSSSSSSSEESEEEEELPLPPPPPADSETSESSSSSEEQSLPPVVEEQEEEEHRAPEKPAVAKKTKKEAKAKSRTKDAVQDSQLASKLSKSTCVRCGAENRADAARCGSCGLKSVELQSDAEKQETQKKLAKLEESRGKLKMVAKPKKQKKEPPKAAPAKKATRTDLPKKQILDMSASDTSLSGKLSRIECSRCGAENRATSTKCGTCGLAVSKK